MNGGGSRGGCECGRTGLQRPRALALILLEGGQMG